MSFNIIRRTNLLKLYADFVSVSQQADPAASIVGLDRAFSAKIQIANTSFSSMKSGSRPVGPKLARQIESACQKEAGWLDEPHDAIEQADEPDNLQAFIKLATRAYKRAGAQDRLRLIELLRASLR